MTVSGTPGSGDVTLLAASSGYQTFATAGATTGDQLEVVFEDGTAWEISSVTYSSSGPSLTGRILIESSTGSLLSLTSAATVFIDATKRALRSAPMGRTVATANNQALQ
jgi:hypothetical protein